ncbi:MAG: NAD(P)/FAD-dependent oxidoreductase [Lachnospira sp.]
MLDVLIIGSGPAGLSASIYAKRSNLSLAVVEKEYEGTGQIAYSSKVDNYLGMMGLSGYDLGEAFRNHAVSMDVNFIEDEVISVSKEENGLFCVKTGDNGIITSKTVVYAAGCVNRHLEVPGEEKFIGKGISFCAVCDGAFYNGKTVVVAGGGDVALDDALYLSDICNKVYLVHRRDTFRGAQSTVEKLKSKSNVEFVTNARIIGIEGDKKVDRILLEDGRTIETDGVFEAVGMKPVTEAVKELCNLDEKGYIIAGETCETSCKGLYAAGDVRTKQLRQVITAAADGAQAVNSLKKYISDGMV